MRFSGCLLPLLLTAAKVDWNDGSETEALKAKAVKIEAETLALEEELMVMKAEDLIESLLEVEGQTEAAKAAYLRGKTSKEDGPTDILQESTDEELKVKFLYTYGAPAISSDPISGGEGECIPGARVYTRNYYKAFWIYSWYSDAAAQWTSYSHPMVNAVELRKDFKQDDLIYSEYENCTEYSSSGEPFNGRWVWEYPRTGSNTPLWDIHNQGIYQNRMWELGNTMPQFEPLFNYSKFTRCLNTQQSDLTTGETNEHYRTESEFIECLNTYDIYESVEEKQFGDHWDELTSEDWDVKAFHAFPDDDDDTDRIVVMKKSPASTVVSDKTTDCVIVFQGSGGIDDLLRFTNTTEGDFCGWKVHSGVMNELRNILGQEEYGTKIVPALQECGQEITAIGHSLGGSLADMFFMCANYGDQASEEYEMLKWWD